MTILYKRDLTTNQDVSLTFISDGKTEVKYTHGYTLPNGIKYLCDVIGCDIKQYYEGLNENRI
jgi:hypothetical protein